ncbi:hypothetical protein LJC33_05025 [Eubacteriales bacterium OttesenSCG-928-N13]|nr:hypothetical protein [Eubacteriales bacterium OttesenSCG-928-N13]
MNGVMDVKWVLQGLAWVVMVALVLMVPMLPQWLPDASESMVARRYDSWSGVLRIWVCTQWQPGSGSFVPWLNKVSSSFQRKHPGVYVQVQPVTSKLLTSFAEGDVSPPDMLLFAPGMLSSAENLLALNERNELRATLVDAGRYQGTPYAVPVAMGGYAWATNARLIDGSPLDDQIQLPAPAKKGDPYYLMDAPMDTDGVCWSGALMSLLQYIPSAENEQIARTLVGEGLDLGLESVETPAPTPPAPVLPSELFHPSPVPDDFRQLDSVLNHFRSGKLAAIPVTQAEIRKLDALSEQGRAPEWEIMPGIEQYTDQLALFSIVNYERNHLAERQALCVAYLNLLLGEDAQTQLSSIRALPVVNISPIYSGQSAMAQLAHSYSAEMLICPNAFDTGFRERAKLALDAALAGE